ncbi:MAG: hypothetical protein LBQ31_03705 [Bacteroidales bacterium]|nr:hypothetical protein [Bacteroidales bacterium]
MLDKRELGKWLLDVAKYVVTAGIISSFIKGFSVLWLLYVICFSIATICFLSGMYFIHKSKK